MILEYWSNNQQYMDDAVVSAVGSDDKVMIFTSDYGPAHHKYLIDGNVLKRYELTTEFFRIVPIRSWRITA